jgi:putative membrane protein
MLQASIKKNDKKAKLFIFTLSFVVFAAVVILSKYKLNVDPGFDVHVFAKANAIINSIVLLLLGAGLITVLQKKYLLHKKIMLTAIFLSVLFLVSYIAHHLLAGETKFGDISHDGILSDEEKLRVGAMRIVYYFILLTHIPLAAIMLPFILFTAYRALTGEYSTHKRLVRITWPVWFYVAFTGVMAYLMISPYYN